MVQKEYLPLTLQQRDIWIDLKINPGISSYNIGGFYRIEGSFDKNLISKTIQHLIQNNDALRLCFIEKDGQILQFFHDIYKIKLPYYDFSDEESPEEHCLALIRSDFNQPFQRMDQPLVEFTLLKAADNLFFLYTKQHHLIIDGYGFGLQVKQTIDIYNKLSRGGTVDFNDKLSFADHIAESQKYYNSKQYEIDEVFWKECYADLAEPISFKYNTQPISNKHAKSKRKTLRISTKEYNLFKQNLKKHRVPIFAFMLGILFCFLHRISGNSDISIGVPLLNRPSRKDYKTIGLYAGVMPFKMSINPKMPFSTFVNILNTELKNCMSHSQYPIGDINKLSGKQLNQRLYNICFSYDRSAFTYSFHNCETIMNWMKPYSQADHLLLTVKENSLNNYTEIIIDYREDVFDSQLPISNILELSRSFIPQVLSNMDMKLCDYEIINTKEKDQILRFFNRTTVDYPKNMTVIDIFEKQVSCDPNKIAIVYADIQITYNDLNIKSNQLANHLISYHKVKNMGRVAIMLRRSEKMVIAIWGVLKSGAAYIPIDPDYPEERIEYMLEDSKPNVIITDADLISKFNIEKFPNFIDIGNVFQANKNDPKVKINANDIAYIIYTSGTTGKPKGAMNTHKGIFNRIYWMQEEYKLTPSDKVIQKTPFSFDVSVWEFLWPLMFGASLIVAKPDGHKDPQYLKEMIIDQKITTIHFVPSMLHEFLKTEGIEHCESLLRVICSGEALSTNIRDRFYLKLESELHNLYGPTEAAIDVTSWNCRETSHCKDIPIGKPIANTEIYIVDQQMRLLPQGLSGEICIGGVGVAVGYWNRPQLTSEKFVRNPFRSGEKMYRTGDLGRWLPDGNIEFLGRIDDQIKIRGLRIEPKEIESVLLLNEAIENAVVVGEKISSENHVLVAYLMTKSKINFMELRQDINNHIPDYMIPSYFVEIDQIPISPNGKLDKKQLPDPLLHSVDMCQGYVAPKNQTEKDLTDIWQEVLGMKPIGINHDFFSLGGDSIRVIEIVRMANDRQINITALDIFKHKTINQICKVADSRINGITCGFNDNEFSEFDLLRISEHAKISLPRDIIEKCFPVSRMQEFMIREYANWHTPGQVYHFQEKICIQDNSFSKEALISALEELVNKHPVLRTVFIIEDNQAIGQIERKSIDYEIEFKDIQNLTVNNQNDFIALAMIMDRTRPFDLNNQEKPLFRTYAFIKSNTVFELMLSFHHAIIDGWSNINFLNDLLGFYIKIKNDVKLKTVKNSSRSYAQLIIAEKKSISSKKAKNFWTQHLRDSKASKLPLIENRHKNLQQKTSAIYIDKEYVSLLQYQASRHQIYLKDILLSTFFDVLCKLRNVTFLTIGCVTNRRSEHFHQPLDATGLFWNILPIHLCLIEDKLAQAKNIHQILIDVQPYVMYPLPQIFEDQKNSDLFFSTFNYVRFHRAKSLSNYQELRISEFDFFDKFHFPLNLFLAYHPIHSNIIVKIESDDRFFSANQIKDILYRYRKALDNFPSCEGK